MILSHRHQFIFLKTRKTAGTSMEVALSRICGPEDVITALLPEDEAVREDTNGRGPQNHFEPKGAYTWREWFRFLFLRRRKMRFWNHMSAWRVRDAIGEDIWDSHFKFCFERNPWDKVVSWYFWKYPSGNGPSLSEFVLSGEAHEVSDYGLYTIDDELAVDYVGRFERLPEDFAKVCERIGLEVSLELPRAKTQTRKDRRSYRELLGERERRAIQESFARQISLFGYVY